MFGRTIVERAIVLAEIAQLVEQRHGKAQVVGSIPTLGSRIKDRSVSPRDIFAALRAAKFSDGEIDLTLKLESLLKHARTYFTQHPS